MFENAKMYYPKEVTRTTSLDQKRIVLDQRNLKKKKTLPHKRTAKKPNTDARSQHKHPKPAESESSKVKGIK